MKNLWCVYIVTYSGNLLPPFYLGKTSTKRYETEKYYGSPSSKKWKVLWKQELENNPHLFRRKIIRLFETDVEALNEEESILTHFNAARSSLFVNENNGKRNFRGGSEKGRVMSEETKAKISLANKGRKRSEEFKEKIRAAMSGRTLSEEHKEKIRVGNKGKKMTEEAKMKLSNSIKGRSSWAKGKKFSEEHKAKMSAAMRGRTLSEEHKSKLRKPKRKSSLN